MRSVAGSATYVRTLKKKKPKKKSVNNLLKSAYPKKISLDSLSKGAVANGKKFVVKGWSNNDLLAFRETTRKLFANSKI